MLGFIISTMKFLRSLILILVLTSCNRVGVPEATPTPAEPTPVPATPTPTPLPPALTINGVAISQAEFDAQMQQITAAASTLGKTLTADEMRSLVTAEFTDQVLLAEAAAKEGFVATDQIVEEALNKLVAEGANLKAWKAANGYSDESFKAAMQRMVAVSWMRDKIIGAVPENMEQIRAQQILANDQATADRVISRLSNGELFADLALRYDPVKAGMLGWFPRGYLTQPKVEEAAFSLQPGEYSQPVQTDFGFHIIYVIDRVADRPLEADARLTLQKEAMQKWLEAARATVVITQP